MKIGITGATGQLGRLVVKNLKEKMSSANIIALVRSPHNARDLGVEVRSLDYNEPQTLAVALEGIDRLLLISGNEVGKRYTQHKNVIDAARKVGVKHLVYTSLLHADRSGLSLAIEHRQTEELLKGSSISYTILRNGWYTENYTSSIPGALSSGALVGSAGEGKISSASREDYAEAAAIVLSGGEHVGRSYELAGDSAYTLGELASAISELTGKHIPYANLSENEYAEVLVSMGLPQTLAHDIASWDTAASKGDLFDDSHQLSTLIGRKTTPFLETVKQTLSQL